MPYLLLVWILINGSGSFAEGPIQVEGHRGARAQRPENSLVGFQYALELGVTTLEMDMQVTRDNVLVTAHDAHLGAAHCTKADGALIKKEVAIRSLTRAELEDYRCGSVRDPRFPKQLLSAEKIPSLDEVFEEVKKKESGKKSLVRFNIETKITPEHPELSPTPEEFVDLFVSVVRKQGMMDRVTLQSFDFRTLKAARSKEPLLKTSALLNDNRADLVGLAKELSVQVLSPRHDWISAKQITDLHKVGVQVIPWTVNDSTSWERLMKMGVDGIITDDPEALIRYLTKKGATFSGKSLRNGEGVR